MSPFDNARYARLLKGLDATEIALSKLMESNEVFRIDAERFSPHVITLLERLGRDGLRLVDVASPRCKRFSPANSGEFDYIEIGGVNSEGMVNAECLSQSEAPSRAAQIVEAGDVITSTVRPIRRISALIMPEQNGFVCSSGFVVLKPRKVAAELLLTYLRADPICKLMDLHTTASMYPAISEQDLLRLPIPHFSENFEKTIATNVRRAYQLREESVKQIAQAETTLLHTLGLADWEAPAPLTYIRSSQDVFATGRMDAEFFTPRVRDMLARLGRDSLTIRDLAPARKERFKPADSGDFHYIEIGGLGADGTAQAECLPQREAPSRATQYVRAGDVITSTVRPIRRLSAVIDPTQDGYVCSSGFVVLQPRGISSDVLLTYLRLPPVCALMDLHTSASMYPAISEADLLALPIPQIPAAAQRSIEKSVQAAQQAKQRATHLLDIAKRAVEIAIEHDEKSALAYLEANAG